MIESTLICIHVGDDCLDRAFLVREWPFPVLPYTSAITMMEGTVVPVNQLHNVNIRARWDLSFG